MGGGRLGGKVCGVHREYGHREKEGFNRFSVVEIGISNL